MIREGQLVRTTVRSRVGYAVGDEARVLNIDDGLSHVRWTTGARTGKVDLVRVGELESLAGSHHALPEEHLGLWSEDGRSKASLEDLDMGWD